VPDLEFKVGVPVKRRLDLGISDEIFGSGLLIEETVKVLSMVRMFGSFLSGDGRAQMHVNMADIRHYSALIKCVVLNRLPANHDLEVFAAALTIERRITRGGVTKESDPSTD
jgi:hypothetical protein